MFYYLRKRFLRGARQGLLVLAFCASAATLLAHMQGQMAQQQEQKMASRTSIQVQGLLSDGMGMRFDWLSLSDVQTDLFWDQNGLLAPFVRDVAIKLSIPYVRLPGQSGLKQPVVTCLTGLDALPQSLQIANGPLTFFSGFDDTMFQSEEAICLVHPAIEKQLAKSIDGARWLDIQLLYQDQDENRLQTAFLRFRVAGTADLSDESAVLAPYSWARRFADMHKTYLPADSLRFIMRDNSQLKEFRDARLLYFADPSMDFVPSKAAPHGEYRMHGMVMHDSQYLQAVRAIERSLRMTRISIIGVFVLTIATGVLLSYLTLRNRRQEMAILLTLGTSKHQVAWQVFCEQGSWALLGAVAGYCLFCLAKGQSQSLLSSLWLAGAYSLTALLSAWRFSRTAVITLLKEKE